MKELLPFVTATLKGLGPLVHHFEGKRVLLTGARGFLGRQVVACFVEMNKVLARPCEILAVDSRDFAPAEWTNIPHLSSHRHDVRLGVGVIPGKLDMVLHLAGIASPYHYKRLPLETIDVAVAGSRQMLELAKEHKATYLFTSSSEVYQTASIVPTPESYVGAIPSMTDRSCYSEDTEVLSRTGWKKFSALSDADELASVSPEGSVSYHVPAERVTYPYTGDLLRFENLKMDLLVTPNHKMVTISPYGEYRLLRADENIYWRGLRTQTGGTWSECASPERWVLPLPPPNAKSVVPYVAMDDWLEFLGLYLAEGCVCKIETHPVVNGVQYSAHSYRIILTHDYGVKRERIEKCLRRLPWRFTAHNHQFTIASKQLALALEPFGHKSIEKTITRDALNLPPSKLNILFDALMLDGSKDGRCFYTSSYDMLAPFQELALKVGRAATIVPVVRGEESPNPWSDRPAWRVNLRPNSPSHYSSPVKVPYAGNVYCATVNPHHTLIVRRNGKAVVSGNCYDVSKLLGETLAYTYAGMGVDTRIIRIFNSVLADEPVVFSDDRGLHVMRADEAATYLGLHGNAVGLAGISVPSINPRGGKGEQRRASHLIGHSHKEECLQIDTYYGRSIRITKDHSLFTAGENGEIVATRGGDLKVRDRIALAGRVEVPCHDRRSISTVDAMRERYPAEDIAVAFAGLDAALRTSRSAVVTMRKASGYVDSSAHAQTSKDASRSRTSLDVIQHLDIAVPHKARVGLKSAGATSSVPAVIDITDDLLWAMGLFVAEGCFVKTPGSNTIVFSSDSGSIRRVSGILISELGVHVGLTKSLSGAPSARVCSNTLFTVWRSLGLIDGLAHTKRIPAWIMALPLSRLKYFLDGYRAGDGVHSGKKVGNYHEFNTVSEGLKNDLIVALGRFGLVPSTGKYNSTIKKYPSKKYPFWRITLGNVTPWDMLKWDEGATQKLNAHRTGDVVWAQVKKITPVAPTEKVYDFSVPGLENFITGRGVMAHNSFAPGMSEADRRILPRIASAMKANRKLTVYGRQGHLPRRTYTPAANTLLGLFTVLLKGKSGEVYNVGNDSPEVTVPDLLDIIGRVTGLDPRWELVPPPSHYETEPMRRCPDITKLKGLGYRPAMELGTGLAEFFRWAMETYTGEA